MKGYEIVGFEPTPDPVPVAIETVYDRSLRSWRTMLVDADGHQVGDAAYDGTKADRDASIAALRRKLSS